MSETSQASSDNEKSKRPRGSRKRQVHNEVERRRKDKINGWISKIGELLPSKELHKQSKISILEQTVDYIKLLVSEREKLLSENRSEVQADEVKQLQKDLKLVKEQNTVYEKLLQQANVSLNSLPKKALKYSDRFERLNGVLTVKNSDLNIDSRVDSSVQVSTDLSYIYDVNSVSAIPIVASNSPKKAKSVNKNNKAATKNSQKVKNVNPVPATTVSNVPVTQTANQSVGCSVSNSTSSLETVHIVSSSNQVSQGNVIQNETCNNLVKDFASVHSGGVTAALSQFPLMSTAHGSSLVEMCNKSMSAIIIPTGGSILQHFPNAEKPSNTISIICPSTLPIIVPQQVFNVSSVARNVGLSSTFICPGPVSEPCLQNEKSALGNTLLVINPSSVVPISSNISTSARIIMPSQTAVIGNGCGSSNVTHNVISSVVNPVPLTPSEQVIVPLKQKAPSIATAEKSVKCTKGTGSASSQDLHEKSASTTSSQDLHEKGTSVNSPTDGHIVNLTSERVASDIAIATPSSLIPTSSSENETAMKESEGLNKNKTSTPSRQMRNISYNSLPSLQVLSANKIISLANQSQKGRSSLSSPTFQKESTQTPSVSLLPNANKSSKSSNNFCLQIDTPGVSTSLNTNKEETPISQTIPVTSSLQINKKPDLVSKSNFSLTVLMGDCINDKSDCSNPTKTKQLCLSDTHHLSPTNTILSSVQSTNAVLDKYTTCSVATSVTTITYSSVPVPGIASRSVKDSNSIVDSTAQFNPSYTILNTGLNPELQHGVQKPNFEKSLQSSGDVSGSSSNATQGSNVKSGVLCTTTGASTSLTSVTLSHMNNGSQYLNVCAKNNSVGVKDLNILHNHSGHKHCSDLISSSVAVDSVNNTFNETVPCEITDSTLNQNIMPLFSTNQIVTLNSPVFMCPVQENTPNSVHLPHNVRISSEVSPSTTAPCMLYKDSIVPGVFPMLSVSNESSKRPNESETNVLLNSRPSGTVSNFTEKTNAQDVPKSGKASTLNESSKQAPNAKKKKNAAKTYKSVPRDLQTICNTNDVQDLNSSYELNKAQSNEHSNSFSKHEDSDCLRQEFNSSMFTSDILARATESIFENDILDSPHGPKGTMIYYTDNGSNINVPVSVQEKQNDNNYKIHCTPPSENHVETTAIIPESSKKNMGTNNIYATTLSNQANNQNSQELQQKQNKTCKIRKSKSSLDLEPPLKKLKESSDPSVKSTSSHNFENPQQITEVSKRTVPNTHSIIPCEEKQTSTESNVTETDHSVIDSIGHFGNQIHLPESNCKTPTSVDAIFSLTPMLGDILKDVSHGMSVETRNNYLSCNDNQSLFPGEKNFLSLNFATNSNEEYINLPRMHFPVSSEISVAPILPATNVSFAHSMSLCSTQGDISKTTETLSSTDPQTKADAKKNALCNTPNSLNLLSHNLAVINPITKASECITKISSSEPSFSIASKVTNVSSSSLIFDSQNSSVQASSLNISHPSSSIIPQTDSHFPTRDNFVPSSHSVTFYPPLSSSTNLQNFVSSSSSVLPHTNFHSNSSANLTNLSFPIQTVNSGTNTTYHPPITVPKVDSLSHSLCSLLKETSNILVENRIGTNVPSAQNMSSTSNSNISQSKYSALSLISDHSSYSETPTSSACHSEYVHSSVVCTPTISDAQFTSTNSSCSRNQRSSLSYSAESLLQTSCASSEKNKNKNVLTNRYPQRTAEKKSDRNNITNMHISDTNIFMPVSNCDISIQNAPLVPLPPVTSFHNFSSAYTLCDTVPSTTIFNSVTRAHDIPLSLSNENFLNHMNLSVESQMLGNRHDVTSNVPKPHTNITLPFESHGSLYNNCNFLPHVKPTLETSRASESAPCFPSTSFSNNYSQSSQKTNCCHFPHRNLPTNPEHPADISLSVGPPVPSFHTDKSNFQTNRPSLQTTFPQSNANFVGNLFYNATNSSRDANEMTSKPSNLRPSQESFVPEGPRQNLHDHNPIFSNRKAATSNRSKSKKGKTLSVSEGTINMVPNSISNFPIPQDLPCSKTNISCVPNGYFKNNAHSVIPPPPSQLPCSQHKISENAANTVIPTNPPFNSVLHQQGDNFFNLNFQPSNFTMSPLPRPPTQPLSCSCLTTPIISHTFSSTNHPVPNFNLSNILTDMGCPSNQVPLPPVKFQPVNHGLQSSSAQCQTNSTISNSAHIISHQSCAPALYPPHPPIVRGSLNPILSHNPQSFSENQVSLVGSGATPVMPQNATFSPTQNPPFRNVIHSLSFPCNER